MRPVKIVMQAFGPYPDKAEVEFDRLGSHGVYLISGKTGAGKTSIFDGVCYGLFGEASGRERKTKMLRSKYGDRSLKTYVELTFEYGGRLYKVHREPSGQEIQHFDRDGSSKGLRTLSKLTNELYEIVDGTEVLIASGKELDGAVKGILGLDIDQYRSCAMIAQGAFSEVLNKKSSQREEILRSIFMTGKFNALSERIKADCDLAQEKYYKSDLTLRTYLNSLKLSREDPELETVGEFAKQQVLTDLGAVIECCERAAAYENEQAEKAGKELEQARREEKLITVELENARKNAELFDRKAETEKRIAELVPKLEEIGNNCEKLKSEKPAMDKLSVRAMAVMESFDSYDRVDQLLKTAEKAARTKAESDDELKKLAHRTRENTDRIPLLKKRAEELAKADVKLSEVSHSLKEQEQLLDRINEVGAAMKELDSLLKKWERSRRELKAAGSEYQRLDTLHSELLRRYIRDRAGTLAGTLRDDNGNDTDRPCPVCGSTVHPALAELMADTVAWEEVETAKTDAENANTELKTKVESEAELKAQAAKAKEKLNTDCKSIIGETAEELTEEKLREKYEREYSVRNALVKEAESLKRSIADREQAKKDIAALEKQLGEDRRSMEELNLRSAGLFAEMKSAKDMAEELSSKLEFKDRKAAGEEADRLSQTVRLYEQRVRASEKSRAGLSAELSELRGGLSALEQQTRDKARPDLDEIGKRMESAVKKVRLCQQVSEERHSLSRNSADILTKIKDEAERNKRLSADLVMKDGLSRTVTGNVPGKPKITLESFVQFEHFDRILEYANVRLMQMTDCQYELVRDESMRGNSKTGLDIYVRDNKAESSRETESLSGGEKFKAALALALGFSDEIQNCAGGVKINSMFIDEGFDSLDEDSLDQAVEVLRGLAGESRLVGVISHVKGLREKLPRGIEVRKKTVPGSEIEIVTR